MTTITRSARTALSGGMTGMVSRSLAIPASPWHAGDARRPGLIDHTADTAGPITDSEIELGAAPTLPLGRWRASLALTLREADVVMAAMAELGGVIRTEFAGGPGRVVLLSHPAHIASLMARPAQAESATRYSPLRPIVGPDSVLTAVGARHKQQRGLLLPQFHGRAVADYQTRIEEATDRRIDEWQPGVLAVFANVSVSCSQI